MKINLVGPSYQDRSLNFDAQRSINLYPVKSETGDSKNVVGLAGTPGLSLFCTLPTNINRGSHEALGRAFEIFGNALYELYADGSYVMRGTLLTDTGYVSLADNGQQLCIVDGPNGYIFDGSTNVFTQITDPYFIGASTVDFIDGYFMFSKPGSAIYYISALYNGLTGDPLDFASAEGSPDGLVGLINVHQQVWLFGTGSVEIVYNSGAADFPFQRIQGTYIEYGCAAPASIAKTANTVFWLGKDEYGQGVVWMAQGYQPQRISTYAIEYAIQQLANISDATAYTYQEDGHYFYVLNFSFSNSTFVYDIGLNLWHERAAFSNGFYTRNRPQTHIFAFNRHLVGDYQNGNVYVQSLNNYSDNGSVIRRLRTCQHLADDLEYIYYSKLQVDMETGVGLDGANQIEPQVMLSWSDDGGHVYTPERWASFGKIGAYRVRALWRRLGRSRDRVFRLAITSMSKVFIIAGHIDTEKGSN